MRCVSSSPSFRGTALGLERLAHRAEQRLRILRAGHADLAVEDEERHAADSRALRLVDLRAHRFTLLVARQIRRQRGALQPGASADISQDLDVSEVLAVDEV